jgi:thiol-disulfide isomerase/thioredoxin
VLSFHDLDCFDCGVEVAEALIQDPRVYKTRFDKRLVELTVVADPSVDALALANAKRADVDAWTLVRGAGHGSYAETAKPAELDVVEVAKDGQDVPSLDALAVPGKITIVDLYATWCGPCHELDAHIVEVMKTRKDLAYRRLDVGDWDTPLGEHWLTGIEELPYVLVFGPTGARKATFTGLDLPAFDAAIAPP